MNRPYARRQLKGSDYTAIDELLSSLDQTVIPGLEAQDLGDSRTLTEVLMSQTPQVRRKGYSISLYLPVVRDPIEIWNIPVTTLGRRDNRQQIYPTVDLAGHHAVQLGVSRLHAQIVFKDGCFYLLDLASKNGTWLNGKQLCPNQAEPISHRDTLRIGHLIIHVGACQYS
jgi:hypothetical protein